MAENYDQSETTNDESLIQKVTNDESLIKKITEKLQNHHSSSSSSSSSDDESHESDKKHKASSKHEASSAKSKAYRLFGREKPVHQVLGGGKPADVFMWRNKKVSAGVLGSATAIWVLFELLEYHLLSIISYILIAVLATLFIWASATKFITKSPPQIPDFHIPEDTFLQHAQVLRTEINRALAVLREIASGNELKKFLGVIVGLWFLAIVGRWFHFLTLFYIAFVLLHTVPVLYEKYEDKVDPMAENATIQLKKHYEVFDSKVLSKVPLGPLKGNKAA